MLEKKARLEECLRSSDVEEIGFIKNRVSMKRNVKLLKDEVLSFRTHVDNMRGLISKIKLENYKNEILRGCTPKLLNK